MTIPKCHPDRKHKAKGRCEPCYGKHWRTENRDETLEYDKQWRAANPDKVVQHNIQYYQEHREELLEYARQYHQEHHEERLGYARKWRVANPEYARQWREVNRDKARAQQARRRARRLQSPAVPFTPDPIDGKTCFYCGEPAEHWDHFTPLSRGGGHLPGNLVPACASCNSSKHARMPEEIIVQLPLGRP